MKWEKALNGYYYTKPDSDTFYTIEVTKNSKGVTEYTPTINLKNGDYNYLWGGSWLTLKTAKKRIEEDYKENKKKR